MEKIMWLAVVYQTPRKRKPISDTDQWNIQSPPQFYNKATRSLCWKNPQLRDSQPRILNCMILRGANLLEQTHEEMVLAGFQVHKRRSQPSC